MVSVGSKEHDAYLRALTQIVITVPWLCLDVIMVQLPVIHQTCRVTFSVPSKLAIPRQTLQQNDQLEPTSPGRILHLGLHTTCC